MASKKQSVNISCEDRAKQFPKGILHADGGKLFCTICNVTLDHTRKGSIDRHLETQAHRSKREANDENSELVSKRQCTIVGMFNRQTESRDARNLTHFKLVEAFTVANIPLAKLDHPKLREYLQESVKNLGSLPNSSALRRLYQPKVYAVLQEELLLKVSSFSSISIATDESSDVQDRYVLHILFIPQIQLKSATSLSTSPSLEVFCVDIVNLEHVNSTTVSQAIVQCLTKYKVDFANVSAFLTDNATYMTKAYENETLKGLLPNCVHITCNAHILNLVGETWRSNFPAVDKLVASFKKILSHCPSRKQSYINFMQQQTNDAVQLPPVPVMTRWGSWFATVCHHSKYINFYREFVEQEIENSQSLSALELLSTLLENEEIENDLIFVARNCGQLVELLKWFEGRQVNIHQAYNRIADLLSWSTERAKDLTLPAKHKKAFSDMTTKLTQYYMSDAKGVPRFRQQGVKFFKAVRLFDPHQAKILSLDGFKEAIPGLSSNSRAVTEALAYKNAVNEVDMDVSPLTYWSANISRFPELTKFALRFLSIPPNSVDAERCVSCYTQVNSAQRQSFLPENLFAQVMFAFNASQ